MLTPFGEHPLLVAPSAYIAANRDCHRFDAYLTLEELSDWLGSTADPASRYEYKQGLVRAGLDRASLRLGACS